VLLIGTSTMIMTARHREPLAEPGLTHPLREAHYGRSLGGLSRMSVSAESATAMSHAPVTKRLPGTAPPTVRPLVGPMEPGGCRGGSGN
jgi:hypothetical protein